ncbi:hypothetical protein : Uncharacterized protein OS=Singulisphaera acidiphila (strain ATCC BAA-1392 / DSM 18658 / VKM B-2454 / MOB10) GN=Sinac_0935 PE=4 SV=1 [Gemmataceae bacterium]|nr:hypothetical protein : Uncharacterized protein OS=Singulisphaera acidiphila (strain ATCC BAA-1392 / DSM 18658 / VKM B-2454 / MOB10) GN=Sinac_0935 PE=4 SV=1 [Gemmataceae bacterium]VTT97130.1 hypothetical protein : Uncharacterized protein OS=Singulisphaera acidiphila (strain ATCC BAA-1392 / DSM 18658 / VKM B-2454 / MOB10) GN=Sinac_0935 PE=4 SV=1 [Gemmataceae bacterium]
MRCQRFLFVLAVFAAPAAAPAQPPKPPAEGKWVIPMTVDATGPARPALKHRLLPELRDLQPGNQVQAFYKCFFEQQQLFHNKEASDRRDKWLDAPLKDLVAEKELVNYGGSAVRQAHYAARLDATDWQITTQARAEGIMLLLPDVQQMRSLATVLRVRVRGEIARGEFEAAVQTLQTMFALARAFNEHPTLIGHLVGIAIASMALGEVEELAQQPGAPNLFWALTDLPAPFLDLRKGGQGERLLLAKEFALLARRTPAADQELKEFLKIADPLVGMAEGKVQGPPSVWYASQAGDKDAVAAARDRLLKAGYRAAELDKFSPLQIVLTDDFTQYEVTLDEYIKWTNLPFWQVPGNLDAVKRPPGPFGNLAPAWYKVMLARVRLQQHLALVTAAEGLRAHAAENGGRLPAALDAVKLPLPVDPVTGKPFAYELKGGTGVLSATPPADQLKNPAHNRVYHVTVRGGGAK